MSSTIRGSDNFDTAGGNAVKAWVNFNGTGTVAIRAAFNVSSITDNGVGYYSVNFTNALADINYAAVVSTSSDGAGTLGTPITCGGNSGTFRTAPLTTGFNIYNTSRSNTATDAVDAVAAVFR